MMTHNDRTRAGLVAVAGRPNVGKSTLVNALVGEKISIVTHKPQTTRHRITGVVTTDDCQIGLIDTPGLHADKPKALNRVMIETAEASLSGVDAAVLVVVAGEWREDDERALRRLRTSGVPVGLVINKIDRVRDRARLLPYIDECRRRHAFAFVVPLSATREDNLKALMDELRARMPDGPFLFPADDLTDRDLRFIAAETVREKLMLVLQQELPYAIAVAVESFREEDGKLYIHAVIWVSREGHKRIVIGHGGRVLKEVGQRARLELSKRLEAPVDLRLWVKVRERWDESEASVRDLGH